MFGIVTKTQLRQHAEELRRDVEAGRRDIEELKFACESWFDKFRTLYARLLKRDRVGAAGAETGNGGESPETPKPGPAASSFPHSRRGF